MAIRKALASVLGGFREIPATDQIACDAGAMTVTETGASSSSLVPDLFKAKANAADLLGVASDTAGLFSDLSEGAGLDLRASETTAASQATVDLATITTLKVAISGSASISSFGTQAHIMRRLRFTGSCTLVYNATSLILPTGASIVTAPGDTAWAFSDASGNWTVGPYQRADGRALTHLFNGGTVSGTLTMNRAVVRDGLKFVHAFNLASGTDLNTVTEGGFYDVPDPVNGPGGGWWYLQVEQHVFEGGYLLQRAVRLTSTASADYWVRNCLGGTWTAWKRLLSSDDAKQVIAGNSAFTSIPTGATRYFTDGKVSGAPSEVYVPAGRRGRFSNLRAITQGAPGSGQSWTFTLQKLFSDTALTCTISGSGSNQASDLANTVDFEATDRWCIKVVSSGGAPATTSIGFSMLFLGLD